MIIITIGDDEWRIHLWQGEVRVAESVHACSVVIHFYHAISDAHDCNLLDATSYVSGIW